MNTRPFESIRDFPSAGDEFGALPKDQADGLAERPTHLDYISERVVSYVKGATKNGHIAEETLVTISELGGKVEYNMHIYEQADLPSDTRVVKRPGCGAVAIFVRGAVVHVLDENVEDQSQPDGYNERVYYGRVA